MARQKNNKQLEPEAKPEVTMSESKVLESLETEIDRARVELENTKRELQEKIAEMKAIPAREYSKEELAIVDKQIAGFAKDSGLKEKIEKQKTYDDAIVRGKFINRRAPGQSVKLTYMKYATDPVKWWPFDDGKVYSIPRGFAEQINDYYHTPVFTQKQGPMDPNEPESQIHSVDTSNKKYAFVPISF